MLTAKLRLTLLAVVVAGVTTSLATSLPRPVRGNALQPGAVSPVRALTAVRPPAVLAQAGSTTADVVVDFGDGRVRVGRTVPDSGTTGLDLLAASGVQLVTGQSGAVCAIENIGCPASDCFCACPSPDNCRFWSYFHATAEGGWIPATTGAGEYIVTPGTVDGWVWGPGQTRRPILAPDSLRGALLGLSWLQQQVQPNGSLLDDPGLTADLLFAAHAVGTDAHPSRRSLSFLASRAVSYSARGAAQAGKLAAAVAAAGADPHSFGRVDLVGAIGAYYDAASGRFGSSNWDQAWALIGLAAAAEPIPEPAVTALIAAQNQSGGWGVTPQSKPDPDSTGLVLQALAAAGEDASSPSVASAYQYLRRTQRPDGGWAHLDPPSSTNSTALVVQGLLATHDPLGADWPTPGGGSPIEFLLSQQLLDGRFEYDTSPADLMATVQVLPALVGQPLPLVARRVSAERAVAWILASQNEDGSFRSPNPIAAPAATSDAVVALAALGHDPNPRSSSGHTPAEYLAQVAPRFVSTGPSGIGRLALGVRALGANPRQFGGVDLALALQSTYRPSTGAYGSGSTWDGALAILGLRASGVGVPPEAVDYLLNAHAADGGWGTQPHDSSSDISSTGLALQALAAARVSADHPVVWQAIELLRRRQRSDGGFSGRGTTAAATATARAIGGLVAFGQVVEGPGWRTGPFGSLKRNSPVEGLVRHQSGDGGFSGTSAASDPLATYAAALGLSLRPLPLGAVARPIFLPLLTQR